MSHGATPERDGSSAQRPARRASRPAPARSTAIGLPLLLVAVIGLSLAQRARFAGTPDVEFVPATAIPSTTAPSSLPTTASGAYFPGPDTTGIDDTVSLSPGPDTAEWVVTNDVEGTTHTGTIRIGAPGVTLRNVRIVTDRGLAAVDNRDNYPGLVVEFVEVTCIATDPTVAAAVLGAATVRRSDLAGCVDGIIAGSGSRIEENYIHDLRPGKDDFSEGIVVQGGDDVVIRGNTVLGRDDGTRRFNAAVYVADGAGPVQSVTVEANYVDGFGVSLQLNGAGVRNSSLVGNVIGTGHLFGPYLVGNGAEAPANGNRAVGNRRPDGTPIT